MCKNNMKTEILIPFASVLFACALTICTFSCSSFKAREIVRAESDSLTERQLADSIASAEGGDADAAYRLYVYYGEIMLDAASSRRWYVLAKKLGDPRCILTPEQIWGR